MTETCSSRLHKSCTWLDRLSAGVNYQVFRGDNSWCLHSAEWIAKIYTHISSIWGSFQDQYLKYSAFDSLGIASANQSTGAEPHLLQNVAICFSCPHCQWNCLDRRQVIVVRGNIGQSLIILLMSLGKRKNTHPAVNYSIKWLLWTQILILISTVKSA